MTFFETAIVKTLSATGRFLPQLSARIESRLIADHGPILSSPNFHHGGRFWLWLVVAPSRSPKQLDPVHFTENAYALARLIFADQPFKVGYSGSSECRYRVPDSDPHPFTEDVHILRIFPDGRVALQWGLQTTPLPHTPNVQLSLDEIVAVLCHMHGVAHTPQFSAIHARRRTERMRRLDWRVGLTPSISTVDHGSIYWRNLTSSTGLPDISPIEQNPSCPVQGFASESMRSLKRNVGAADTFSLALSHLLVDAGYTNGVRESVSKALAAEHPINRYRGLPSAPALENENGNPEAP